MSNNNPQEESEVLEIDTEMGVTKNNTFKQDFCTLIFSFITLFPICCTLNYFILKQADRSAQDIINDNQVFGQNKEFFHMVDYIAFNILIYLLINLVPVCILTFRFATLHNNKYTNITDFSFFFITSSLFFWTPILILYIKLSNAFNEYNKLCTNHMYSFDIQHHNNEIFIFNNHENTLDVIYYDTLYVDNDAFLQASKIDHTFSVSFEDRFNFQNVGYDFSQYFNTTIYTESLDLSLDKIQHVSENLLFRRRNRDSFLKFCSDSKLSENFMNSFITLLYHFNDCKRCMENCGTKPYCKHKCKYPECTAFNL